MSNEITDLSGSGSGTNTATENPDGDSDVEALPADEDESDVWLEDGLLKGRNLSQRDIRFNTIYNRVSEKATDLFEGDVSEVIHSGSDDPADLALGKGITRILLLSSVTIPIYMLLLFTGNFPFIPADIGASVKILVGMLSSIMTSVLLVSLWLVFIVSSVSDESKQINTVLPEALSFMYAQSKSDVNYLNIIRSMALAEDAYGPVAREFQTIVQRCEYFGEDIQTAIKQQADATASDELGRVLRNMLSHIQNGTNLTDFFYQEAQKARLQAKNEREVATDFLSFLSTIYATVGLIPVVGIAVLIGISSFQDIPNAAIAIVAYIVTPTVSVLFIYLIVQAQVAKGTLGTLKYNQTDRLESVEKQDEGETISGNPDHNTLSSAFGVEDTTTEEHERSVVGKSLHPATDGVIDTTDADSLSETASFDHVSQWETVRRLKMILRSPIDFFTDRPGAALYLTLPLTILGAIVALLVGVVPIPTIDMISQQPIYTTFTYLQLPLLLILGPTIVFHQNQKRRIRSILEAFPDTLRRLASANDSGLSLTESIIEVGEDDSNVVDSEISVVAAKSRLGMPIDRGLVEFNNVYKQPQVARSTRLLIEAYRASSHVSDVLDETIESAETALQLRENERSEMRSKVVTIGVISLASTGLLLLVDAFFLDLALKGVGLSTLSNPESISGIGSSGGGSAEQDKTFFKMILYHTATLHTFLVGAFLGFMRDESLYAAMKYGLVISVIVTGVWWYL